MHSVAKAIQYPLLCPDCDRNTSTAAAELLDKKQLHCRHCGELIQLKENQLSSLQRTLTDMDNIMCQTVTPEQSEKA